VRRTRDSRRLGGLQVLVVDDEADLRNGLARLVAGLGAEVETAADGADALERVLAGDVRLVLTDLMMPRMSGAELLAEIKARRPEVEVVILTGFGTIQSAVACLQGGAAHFMTKPFDNRDVLELVGRLGARLLAAQEADDGASIVVGDPSMRAVLELVERAAPSPVPVLIEGESGTGKEVVARLVHEKSAVAARRFLAVNTAALPDTMLESELFGHERGAFTGADSARRGIFREAEGGTVFLDEVASMSASFQSKLMRVLEEKRVRPLGSAREHEAEFRLVAASNRDLELLVRRGEFREDLFYRLGVVRLHLPPLRERPGDVLPLAEHFLRRAARTCLGEEAPPPQLSPAARTALAQYGWPGNVRELENAVQRAVIVSTGACIEPHHLSLGAEVWTRAASRPGGEQELEYAEGKRRAIERFQREFVHRALDACDGNISHAAERCGMTRAALQRIMRSLSIERDGARTTA